VPRLVERGTEKAMISRRTFLATAGAGLLAVPLGGFAQQPGKIYRVGFLWDSPAALPDAMEAFRRGLRDLGWVEGKNLVIEYRWGEGRPERIQEQARELVKLKVDVIVSPSSIYTGAARRATSTIPIVFMSHADPEGSGHVASLARPGGNATGLSIMMTETNAKLLEVFSEAVPGLTRVAVMWDPATPSHRPGLEAVKGAAEKLHLQLLSLPVGSTAEFESAFASAVREKAGGMLLLSTPLYIAEAKRLAGLGLQYKLPTACGPRSHADAGALLSFGPDRADLWRRGAVYVDRILKGAKPADLPVEQPVKFELVINLETAKALGLTIPRAMLVRSDSLIQ
jgi:putative ABC transport system substrate-binding protein